MNRQLKKRKEKRMNKIIDDIKTLRIQSARSIAKAALYAYSLEPTESVMKRLIGARPTEPMLVNSLHQYKKMGYKNILAHFNSAQDKINKSVFSLIEADSVIFTYCHSTNVIQSLIYAKRKGKNFEVYNTETRPFFQGLKSARDLEKAGIKVTMFVDAALSIALEKKQGTRKVSAVFLGADAILKNGVINKTGSCAIAELAHLNKIPLYIIADSWKYSSHHLKIEERDFHEVWKRVPKHIKVRNPAFELVPKKYIHAIVSELGTLSLKKFIKKIRR